VFRDDNRRGQLVGRIRGTEVTIYEAVIRECLFLEDDFEDPIKIDKDIMIDVLEKMWHEGVYLPLEKKRLHPYWKYSAHVFVHCFAKKKGWFGIVNPSLTAGMIALTMDM
jgi:hypothetical protein